MKTLLLSDIHLEHQDDRGEQFLANLPQEDRDGEDIECVILAGDICAFSQLPSTLDWFCDHYTHVVYCWGNHECYGHSIAAVREIVHNIETHLLNLFVLDNNRVQVTPETVFIGGTLWFRDAPGNRQSERLLGDFYRIKDFRNFVYQENEDTVDYLEKFTQEGDIVVTHHMPSALSVHPRFAGHPMNRFFLCDMEDVMKERQPRLWFHGHTHDSFDYTIFRTRVLCNPTGYPEEDQFQKWEPLILDI